jgi:hypothetical protein
MTRRLPKLVAASFPLLLTLAAGCGEEPKPCPAAEGSFACVDGATLVAAAAPSCEFPLTTVEGVEVQTARALEIAGEVWGVDPGDYVTGWVISYCRGWFVCAAAQVTWTYGCAYTDREVIEAAPGPSKCLPGVLIHELGHLVVGDPNHRDPRFAVADALEGAPCAARAEARSGAH